MQLLGIQYKRDSVVKDIVVLLLVEHPDRLACLRSDKLTNNEISILKKMSSEINSMEIKDRIRWMKDNLPSYPSAYRELKREYASIRDSFEI